jgi:hypothetical protein
VTCVLPTCALVVAGGCSDSSSNSSSGSSNVYMCNVFFGSTVQLAPNTTANFSAPSVLGARMSCETNAALQSQARIATGSTTLTCVCGMSNDE